MKKLFYMALFGMVALMSQSCGGADNKNSDSETTDTETENAATEKEESSESSSGISFKIIPELIQFDRYTPEKVGKWYINRPCGIIVCDDSGTPIMYDDENAENYDSFAFAFFCANIVAHNFINKNYDNFSFASESEALNKWESDYVPQIEPFLELCLNMPVAANVCPPQIQEWFNKVYYDNKDKNMYLEDSGYGFRSYEIDNPNFMGNRPYIRIYRFDDESHPEYYGALAIGYHYYF